MPINELYPCEVVLHELIADIRGLRSEAKRTLGDLRDENEHERAAAYRGAMHAWDEAIRLATRKFERCP